MQKRNRKITDRGWASMETTLDKEMPVGGRRRRGIVWWWWYAGAGLMILAGEKALQLHQPENAVQPSGIQSVPVAGVTETGTFKQIALTGALNPALLPATGNKNGSKGFGTGMEQVPATPWPAIEKEAPVVSTELTAPAAVLPPNNLESLTADLKPVISPEAESRKIPGVVASRYLKTVNHSFKRLHLGLTGTVSSEKLQLVNGLAAGLTLTWQPLTHWGLRTGLELSLEKPAYRNRPVADVTAKTYNEYIYSNDWAAKGINGDPGVKVLIPIKALQQIGMPILAYWQPLPRWRFYAGTKFIRTLYANSDKYSYVSGKSTAPSSVLVESRSLNALATQEMSYWKGYGNFGFGFKLSKHLEVNAFTQFLWHKRSNDANYYNSAFEYYLKAQSLSNPLDLQYQLSATLFF
jgi:hypothetical protein